MNAPLAPRRPIRKLQYQHGSPSQPDSQYGVGNQLGGMTGVSSTLGGNNMHPTPESRQPTNNTATTSTATTFTARKLVPPTRRVPATAAAVPGGTTTTAAGATETAEPLVDKPKSKRKDKVPRLPPPQTIVDGGNKKTYTRGPSLGEGGFASCYELRDEEGKRFAAKVIQKVELNTHKTKQKLFAEIKIHQVLRHENIVRYYTCFEDENFVYLLLELCESKTLMDLLKRRKVVTEPEARYYMKEIVAACAHLHQGKIIHRDLKLGNIFLSHDMHVKVGDFGLAALLQNSEERKKTICGTPNYIAPEILFETNGHSFEVDIWSLGCIMYTLLIGKPPFQTNDVKSIYKNIRELNYSFPPEIPISNEAKSLITALLSPRPEQRPTVNTILQDPFFTGGFCPEALPRSSQHTKPKFDHEIAAYHRQKRQARQEEEWLRQQRLQQAQNQHDSNHGARQSLPTPTVHRQQQRIGLPVAKRASPAPPLPAHSSANQFGFGDEVHLEMVKGDQVLTEVRKVNVPRATSIPPTDQFSGSQMQQGQQQLYSVSHRQSTHYAPQDHHHTESTVTSQRQSSMSRVVTQAHSHSHSHQQHTESKAARDALWQMRMGHSINSANPSSASSMTLPHGSSVSAAATGPQRQSQPSTGSTIAQSRLPMPTTRIGQGMASPLASPRFGSVANMGVPGSNGFSPVVTNMEYAHEVPSSPHAVNHLRRLSSDLASAGRANNLPYAQPHMQTHINQPASSPFNDIQRTPTFGGTRALPSNAGSLKTYREQQLIEESFDMDMDIDKSRGAMDDDDDDDRFVDQQNDTQQEDRGHSFLPSQRTSSGGTVIQTVKGIERPASAMKRTYRSGNPFLGPSHGRAHMQPGGAGPSSFSIEIPSKELQLIHMNDKTEDDIDAPYGGDQLLQPVQAATPTRPGFSVQGHGRHSSQHVASSQPSPFPNHSRHLSQQASQPLQRSTPLRQQQGSMMLQQSLPSSLLSQPSATEPLSSQPMERNRSDQGAAANEEWFPTSPSPASRGHAGQSMGTERARTHSQFQRGNYEVGPLDTLPHQTRPFHLPSSSQQMSNLAAFMPATKTQQMYNDSDDSDMDRDMQSIERHLPMNDRATATSTLPATPTRPPSNDLMISTPPQLRTNPDRPFRRRSSHHQGLHRPRPDVVQDSRQQLQQQRELQQQQQQQQQQERQQLQLQQERQFQQEQQQLQHQEERPQLQQAMQEPQEQQQQQQQLMQETRELLERQQQQQQLKQDTQELLERQGLPLRLQREQDRAKRLQQQQQQQLAQQAASLEMPRRRSDGLVPIKREEVEKVTTEEFEVAVKFEDESLLVPLRQEETLHNPSDRPLQETHMSGHSGEQDHVEVPSTSGGATSLSLSISAEKALGPLESVHRYLGQMLREYRLGKFPNAYSAYTTRPVPPEHLVLPSPIPTCYVARWCDYSQAYGTGFGIVNGVTGVLFNDGCVGLLAPNDINVELIIHPNSSAGKKTKRSRSHRSRHSRESGAESGSASDNPSARMTESISSLEGGGGGGSGSRSGRSGRRGSKHRNRSMSRSVSRGGIDVERRGRDPAVSNKAGGGEDTLFSTVPTTMTSSTTLLHKKKPSLTLKREGSGLSLSNSVSSPITTPLATPTMPTAGGEQTPTGGMVGEGSARPLTERSNFAMMSSSVAVTVAGGGISTTQEVQSQLAQASSGSGSGSNGGNAMMQQQDPANMSVSINLRKRQFHDAEDDAYEERLKGRRSVIGRRTGTADTDTEGDSDQENRNKESAKHKLRGQPLITPFLVRLTRALDEESTSSQQSGSGVSVTSPTVASPTATAATAIETTAASAAAAGGGGSGSGGSGGASPKEGVGLLSEAAADPWIDGGLDGTAADDESEESWDEEDAHTVLKSVERQSFTQPRAQSSSSLPSSQSQWVQQRIKMLPQFRDYMLRQRLDVPMTLYKDVNLTADMPFMSGFYQIQQNLLILRLSDGTVQVNFEDHEKLVFSDHGRALIYIKTSKRIFTMSLKGALVGVIFERVSSKSLEGKKGASGASTISIVGGLQQGKAGGGGGGINSSSTAGQSRSAVAVTLAGLDPPSPSPRPSGASPASSQQLRDETQQQEQQQSPILPPPPPPPPSTTTATATSQQQPNPSPSQATPTLDTYRGIVLHPKEHNELIKKLRIAYAALQQLARIRKAKRKQKLATGQQANEEIIITKKKEEAGL